MSFCYIKIQLFVKDSFLYDEVNLYYLFLSYNYNFLKIAIPKMIIFSKICENSKKNINFGRNAGHIDENDV